MLQTDSYLEQLTDTVAEAEMSTQTDPFRDRPSTPLFIPAKAGLDATTQIEAGDLFDFDFEVRCNVASQACTAQEHVLSYHTVSLPYGTGLAGSLNRQIHSLLSFLMDMTDVDYSIHVLHGMHISVVWRFFKY